MLTPPPLHLYDINTEQQGIAEAEQARIRQSV